MKQLILYLTMLAVLATGAWAVGTAPSAGSGNNNSNTNAKAPVTAKDWYATGYAASEKQRWPEAMEAFKKAIALKADYAEAYNMLGFTTRKSGNAAGAFAYYDKALQLKPNFPEAREYYGEAYLESGDLTKAVQQYVILMKAHSTEASELLEKIGDWVNKK